MMAPSAAGSSVRTKSVEYAVANIAILCLLDVSWNMTMWYQDDVSKPTWMEVEAGLPRSRL